jgi:Ca2+-binding RTX toxin-like protein
VQGVQSGVDRIFGGTPGADSGFDTLDFSQATAGVVVQLSGYATTNDPARTVLATFSGIEAVTGADFFADALIGNAAANIITGGGGADWLVGGGGADTFIYRNWAEGAGDSIRDFSPLDHDLMDLSRIDADITTAGDDAFTFSATRTPGLAGELVVTNFGGSSTASLYIDIDDIADMVLQIVHQQGVVLNAGDFVL